MGKGSFGTVWSGVHRKAKTACAIKIVDKNKVGENPVYHKLMMDELKVLEDTDHPNIPKVYALLEDKKNYYIITELISGGNMLDKMMKMQKISENKTAKVIKQVLLCLNYMHKKMITHRDIKLENLLCMP